jgi:hypothetical protein
MPSVKGSRGGSPVKSKIKIKLTDPQLAFLGRLVTEPLEATVNYPPARKLVDLGLAIQTPRVSEINGRLHSHFYSITDAGRTHHRAVYMADRKCGKCKTAPWTCRVCSRKTCEHHCGKKGADGTAICGRKDCQEGKPVPVPVPAAPKLASLSRGDVIVVGSSRLRVTIVDRDTGGIGPLVELEKTAKPHTHYTLMDHAREPGKFVLGSTWAVRVIDGWRKVATAG